MKTKRLYFFLSAILFSLSQVLSAQQLISIDHLRAQDENYVRGMNTGISGKTVVCGDYRLDLTAGTGANSATVNNPGVTSGYIASYDQGANLQFLLALTSSKYGNVQDVYVDDNNAIYASGDYAGVMNLNPSGTAEEITSTGFSPTVSSEDPFLAKYDENGNLLWHINPAESDYGYGSAIIPTPTGSIIWAGTHSGFLQFQYEGATVTYPDPSFLNSDDSFVFEVSSDGVINRHMRVTGSGLLYVENGCYDANGNLYLTGFVQGTVMLNGTDEDYTINSGSSNQKFFILQIRPDWNIGWHITSDGESAYGRGIQVNPNGDLVVAGYYSGEETFKSIDNVNNITHTSLGERDIFIGKYDTNGFLLNVSSIGGSNDDFLHSVYLDDIGQLYLCGSFEGEIDLDPSINTNIINSGVGAPALFVAKYFPDLGYQWSYHAASGVNFGEAAVGLGISEGSIMLAGNFSSTVNFNPLGDESSLTSLGSTDGYLVELTNTNTVLNTNELTDNSIHVFPNPSQGRLTISLKAPLDVDQIKIYDLLGKNVYSEKVTNSSSLYYIEFPMLPGGMYFLSIRGKETHTQSFIISEN